MIDVLEELGCEVDKLQQEAGSARGVLSSIPGLLCWKDREGAYRGCNLQFLEMCGLDSVKELIGKTDLDLCWAEDAAQVAENDRAVLASGKSETFQETLTLCDGRRVVYFATKTPQRNSAGDIVGVVCAFIDITSRLEYEKKLAIEKKRAEEASQAKSDFIANMSHDVRTPVTGMLGVAQALKKNADMPENEARADLLIMATEELLNLLNEIMDAVESRPNSGELVNEIFSPHALVAHTRKLLEPAAQHNTLSLEVNVDADVPTHLKGCARYLDRILLNLTSNAIKFTHQGSVKISLSVASKTDDTLVLRLSVKDTGIGIPKDKHHIIFENFSRLKPSAQGIYKGSGLGLHTVAQHVKELDGTVCVESEEGEGAEFIVTLPFEWGGHINAPEERQKQEETKKIAGLNILLVEDYKLAALMAQNIMLEEKCAVDVVHTGHDALDKVVQHDYDIIFVDLGLPDMDGITLSETMRTTGVMTPIVALTAHASEEQRSRCVMAGIREVLIKPLTQKKFLGVL